MSSPLLYPVISFIPIDPAGVAHPEKALKYIPAKDDIKRLNADPLGGNLGGYGEPYYKVPSHPDQLDKTKEKCDMFEITLQFHADHKPFSVGKVDYCGVEMRGLKLYNSIYFDFTLQNVSRYADKGPVIGPLLLFFEAEDQQNHLKIETQRAEHHAEQLAYHRTMKEVHEEALQRAQAQLKQYGL